MQQPADNLNLLQYRDPDVKVCFLRPQVTFVCYNRSGQILKHTYRDDIVRALDVTMVFAATPPQITWRFE